MRFMTRRALVTSPYHMWAAHFGGVFSGSHAIVSALLGEAMQIHKTPGCPRMHLDVGSCV
jgi:hypothetical protein